MEALQAIHKFILWIHIPAGFISIILFWIPVFTKKGGAIHRKVGKAYYLAMWIVVFTAAFLSIINLLLGKYYSAGFLGYLSVLSGYPLWYSYAILQEKGTLSQAYYNKRKYFNLALFILSCLMFLLVFLIGLNGSTFIFLFFGFLGLPTIKEYRMSKPSIEELDKNRIVVHLRGTIISGIAAYTAFLAFGSQSYLGSIGGEGYWMILPWVAPTILGVIIIRIWKKKYGIKGA